MFKPKLLNSEASYKNRKRYLADDELKEELKRLYINEEYSRFTISKLWGVDDSTIVRWLKLFEMSIRTHQQSEKLAQNKLDRRKRNSEELKKYYIENPEACKEIASKNKGLLEEFRLQKSANRKS